jgi:hypothetical protein
LSFCAATSAVPHPQKASRTMSFSLLLVSTRKGDGTFDGG